jgi:hypothetical protein
VSSPSIFALLCSNLLLALVNSYAIVEGAAKADAVIPPPSWSAEDVASWLTSQVEDIHSGRKFSTSADLFDQGIDR